MNTRTIPYLRRFSTSVTYEVQKTKLIIKRVESHLTDILSSLGGYWSVLASLLILAELFDDV